MLYPHTWGIEPKLGEIHGENYILEKSEAKFLDQTVYDILANMYQYRYFLNLGK
jgi:hypothetical protein